jgi:hypothetical protein
MTTSDNFATDPIPKANMTMCGLQTFIHTVDSVFINLGKSGTWTSKQERFTTINKAGRCNA